MKPLIVGMNNPLSSDQRAALLPYPRGSAGWNLWSMARDVCGVSRGEYRRRLDFRNVLDSRSWDPVAARANAHALESAWEGRRVVLLGRAVLGVLWLTPPASVALWRSERGCTWCWLPHPSGLNREYNDPLLRRVAGLLLEDLIYGESE